jgi:hypothetical protein
VGSNFKLRRHIISSFNIQVEVAHEVFDPKIEQLTKIINMLKQSIIDVPDLSTVKEYPEGYENIEDNRQEMLDYFTRYRDGLVNYLSTIA